MGTSLFAVPILKSLYQNGYSVSVVYTQHPKKSRRGMDVNPTPIQSLSETLNLELRTPLSLKNNKEEYDYLKKLGVSKKVNNANELGLSLVEEFQRDEPKNQEIAGKIENYGQNILNNVIIELKKYI